MTVHGEGVCRWQRWPPGPAGVGAQQPRWGMAPQASHGQARSERQHSQGHECSQRAPVTYKSASSGSYCGDYPGANTDPGCPQEHLHLLAAQRSEDQLWFQSFFPKSPFPLEMSILYPEASLPYSRFPSHAPSPALLQNQQREQSLPSGQLCPGASPRPWRGQIRAVGSGCTLSAARGLQRPRRDSAVMSPRFTQPL